MQTGSPPAPGCTIMNPPPPMLPASGQVTAIVRATATAASTAVPPRLSTAVPTSTAGGDTAATMPLRPVATCGSPPNASGIAALQAARRSARHAAHRGKGHQAMTLLVRISLTKCSDDIKEYGTLARDPDHFATCRL